MGTLPPTLPRATTSLKSLAAKHRAREVHDPSDELRQCDTHLRYRIWLWCEGLGQRRPWKARPRRCIRGLQKHVRWRERSHERLALTSSGGIASLLAGLRRMCAEPSLDDRAHRLGCVDMRPMPPHSAMLPGLFLLRSQVLVATREWFVKRRERKCAISCARPT